MVKYQIDFTPAERAEIKRRQRESEKLIARLATTDTLELQQQLADELCPRFDDWVRGRNRIQSTPTRQPRLVAVIRPRPRGTGGRPRASASRSSAASGDSPDSDEPPALAARLQTLGLCLRAVLHDITYAWGAGADDLDSAIVNLRRALDYVDWLEHSEVAA